MPINSNVRAQISIPESGKFVELTKDSRFPSISVQRTHTGDGSVETTEFSKYAVLTYDINNPNANINGTPFGDNASLDSFGKLRVTHPKTLFDAKQLTDKLPYVFDEIISGVGANSVWQKDDSMTKMTTSNSGEYVIRQTSMHMNYQPGKSMLGYFTGVFTPQINVTKRIGLFQGLSSAPYTPTDGIFIESTDGVNGYVAFKVLKTNGIPYLLSAAQPNWNLDKLDGTGPSRLSINLNHAQLLVIDYEWLGVGRIRCGFNIAGKTIYAHEFTHTNGLSAPYMTSGNQPIRYEIRQTGVGSGFLNHICSSIMSEGGEEYIGTSLTAELTGTAGVNLDATVYRPLLAVRLNPGSHDLAVVLKKINVLNTGNSTAIFKVIMNPTVTGGSLNFVNLASNNNVQCAQGSSSLGLSGGYELSSAYAFKGNSANASGAGSDDLLGELAVLGTRINGTPDVFVVAAKGVEGSTSGVFACVDMILRG